MSHKINYETAPEWAGAPPAHQHPWYLIYYDPRTATGADEMRTYVLSKEQRAAAYDVSNPLGDDFPAHVAACAVAYSSNN